jgi:hypothetical protein
MKHKPLTLTHVNTLIVCGLPSPLLRLIVLQSQYDLTLMRLEFFLNALACKCMINMTK